jgi:hypothetical protein
MKFRKFGIAVFGLWVLMAASAVLTGKAIVYILVLGWWWGLLWFYRGESRNSYLMAIGCLSVCPIFLSLDFYNTKVAHNLALLAGCFLISGAGQEILELKIGRRKLNFGGEILELMQEDLGVKKIWRLGTVWNSIRKLGVKEIWAKFWQWRKKHPRIWKAFWLLLLVGLMTWQALAALRFWWWFYGRAYIKQFLLENLEEILLVVGWYVVVGVAFLAIWRGWGEKFKTGEKIVFLILGASLIFFSWQWRAVKKIKAQRPVIFEVIRIGSDDAPKAAIRGAIFDQTKEGRVYFNGQEMTPDNWTHSVVTVPLPVEKTSEYFAPGQGWQIVDKYGTESEIWAAGE